MTLPGEDRPPTTYEEDAPEPGWGAHRPGAEPEPLVDDPAAFRDPMPIPTTEVEPVPAPGATTHGHGQGTTGQGTHGPGSHGLGTHGRGGTGRTANGLTVHDPADERAATEDPLGAGTAGAKPRMFTRISAAWLGVWAGVLVVVLLIIFIGQNTADVRIRFLWLDGNIPTALALLIAGVGGAVIAMAVSAARIVQLRRQVRRRR